MELGDFPRNFTFSGIDSRDESLYTTHKEESRGVRKPGVVLALPSCETFRKGSFGEFVREIDMTTRSRFILAVCGASALFAVSAQADVILGNYPFTNDLTQSAALSDLRVKAISFVMPAGPGYWLDSVKLRLGNYDPTDILRIEIRDDNAGVPGSTIASIVMPPGLGAANMDYTGVPAGATALAGGVTYWLWVSGVPAGGTFDWKASSPGVPYTGVATVGLNRFSTNGGATFTASSILNTLEINGTLIPAPGAMGLLALAGLAALRRRR